MKNYSTIFVLLALWLVPSVLPAATVNESAARKKAQSFLNERGINANADIQSVRRPASARRMKGSTMAASTYHVFNVPQERGFVIVSGDDRTPAILGYADSGSFNPDNMPDGLRWMLEGYEEQMEWLDSQKENRSDEAYETRSPRKAPARSAIAPMVQTHWNQGKPYNNNCPVIGDEKTVTGCVATAMAQVMYYHKWPEATTVNIPGYTTETNKIDVEGLSPTTFDWNDMTTDYSSTATGSAADAVAKLMQYCGVSLQMDYGLSADGGSGAFNLSVGEALKKYFGYDSGVQMLRRQYCTYQEWVSILYSELAARRPIVLGGQSIGGGHSFVCDGYQDDDYFHINWGWGGNSDGYFRLSLLNPREQGIGGSSTLDGFSYSQDAIIGIQKGDGNSANLCLSLEGQRFGASDSSKTKTFTRSSSSDSFTGIGLYLTMCSYQFDTTTYDYAVQLIDDNGLVVQTLATEKGQEIDFNTDFHPTWNNLEIPPGIDNGTYYIKVVSRSSGASFWLDCYAASQFQMIAVISDNTLTITAPKAASALPTTAEITVDGSLTQGYEQSVTASITGGSADYHGNVILRVNGTAVMGKTLDIPAGQTVDAHYTFIPTNAGDNTLTLHNSKTGGSQIGGKNCKTKVNIVASDATDQIALKCTDSEINNLTDGGKLYGNAFRATVTVKNNSTDHTYVGTLHCSMRKWTFTDNGNGTTTVGFTGMGVTDYPLTVAKNGGETTVEIARDGLEPGAIYSFRVTHLNTAAEGNVTDVVHFGFTKLDEEGNGYGTLTGTDGYRLGYADGTTTIHAAADAIDTGTADFVDLTAMSNTSGLTVTPSSNPNCLYLLASGATTPSGLTGKNVVKGSTAERISLEDGHDFYSPIDFTAANISYTRTFTRAATSTGGWNTLCLPFTVTSVTTVASGGSPARTLDWFRSDSETGKNFWLKTMTGDDNGAIYFDHANALQANTPYIIALPGEDFGSEWQLTGKAITFSATNAAISATKTGTLTGNSFKICGSTVKQNLNNVYMLNTNGNKFIMATQNTQLPAFRAWIEAVSISSLSRPQLIIADGEINGISASLMNNEEITNNNVYDLQGRRVDSSIFRSQSSTLKKGIYIVNGKKVIY